MDSHTLQPTSESGGRAGYDGAKRRKGGKAHAAVDPLGYLLTLKVTATNEQDRAQVAALPEAVQAATGEAPAAAAVAHGAQLEVVKHPQAKPGFVLLPRRRVVERSFAWAARFRRLARDYERPATSLADHHWFAFAWLMHQSIFAKSA